MSTWPINPPPSPKPSNVPNSQPCDECGAASGEECIEGCSQGEPASLDWYDRKELDEEERGVAEWKEGDR